MHINEEFKIVVSDKVRYEPYLNLHGKKIHFHDGLNKSKSFQISRLGACGRIDEFVVYEEDWHP